jgi:hypothetical protein
MLSESPWTEAAFVTFRNMHRPVSLSYFQVPQAVARSLGDPTGCRSIKHLNNYPPSADINAPSRNNDKSKILFVCRGGMVEPWRNTFAKSKQKHNAPSHNNDNSEKMV